MMNKKSYPENTGPAFIQQPHNTKKWLKTMQDMYQMASTMTLKDAFDSITKDWDSMEKKDFKNWMSFYQGQNHEKYITAQHWNNGGGFLPQSLKAKIPGITTPEQVEQKPAAPKTNLKDEKELEDEGKKKQIQLTQDEEVQKKIKGLIGRLTAAEKLATDPYVQVELKKVLEIGVGEWLKRLQELKRDVQLIPMRRTAATADDLVIKSANQLHALGAMNAAYTLLKIADMSATQPPSVFTNPAYSTLLTSDVSADNLNKSFMADDGEEDENAELEVHELEVTAQEAPLPQPRRSPPVVDPTLSEPISPEPVSPEQAPGVELVTNPQPPADVTLQPEPAIEVEDDSDTELKLDEEDPFSGVLSNVKVSDIIARLEGVANMYKNREIPRQLTIIDLMMDAVGIASFFPSMAEATKSSLESNQYCQTRIEDILAKLRGIVSVPLTGRIDMSATSDSELAKVREKLNIESKNKDSKREMKQMEEMSPMEQNIQNLAPQPEMPEAPMQEVNVPRPARAPQAPPVITNAPETLRQ